MSFDYPATAIEAAETLADVGGPCTLTRTPRSYDPSTSSADAGAPKKYTCNAVRIEYSLRERDTGLLDERDCKLLLDAVGSEASGMTEPKQGDEVSFAGLTYQVVTCKPLSPAGTAVLYEVQARKP